VLTTHPLYSLLWAFGFVTVYLYLYLYSFGEGESVYKIQILSALNVSDVSKIFVSSPCLFIIYGNIFIRSNSHLYWYVSISLDIENSKKVARAIVLMLHSVKNNFNKNFMFMRSIIVPRFVKIYWWH
jgi:hypothetical protein